MNSEFLERDDIILYFIYFADFITGGNNYLEM